MANTDQGEGATKRKRVTRSRREWIDADGEVVEKIEDATGSVFALLADDGKTDAGSWPRQRPGDMSVQDFGYWSMGYQTRLGNIANTVLNEQKGTTEEACDTISEFVADPTKWAEPRGGPRTDLDRLAQAIADCNATDWAAKQIDAEKAKAEVRARLEASPELVRTMLNVDQFADRYRELTPRKAAPVTAADAMAKLGLGV